jgi:UDP-2,3-diacylglucosamine hydrolase
MSHNIKIKEGAFVVSDAHYSHLRPQLLDFLKDIHSKKLKPTQLILMGDIFDTLFGGVPTTTQINYEAVNLLNDISLEIEVIYLEGNHDFNIKNIFPNIKVFAISSQPLACEFNGKKILLAHGDFATDLGYKIYTSIIRNSFVLLFLRVANFLLFNLILKKLDEYLSKKNDCKDFNGFSEFIARRLENRYQCDYFIEGHYHQNKTIELKNFIYLNLGAFACNQRYFIVKSLHDTQLLEEINFSKEI